MKAKDIMTKNCICCEADTTLEEVAKLMLDYDCGCIPITDTLKSKKIIGVITDRDIICRVVALGKNVGTEIAGNYMSPQVTTISETTSLKELCNIMKKKRVRRLPVVDKFGKCTGIVSQADVARHALKDEVGEMLKKISEKVSKIVKRLPKLSAKENLEIDWANNDYLEDNL